MKTWLITGASSGLGRKLSETVLLRGDKLIATARDIRTLGDLTSAYPQQAQVLQLDVTSQENILSVTNSIRNSGQRLDVLVNNAGFGLAAALESTDDEHLAQNLETNLIGPLKLTRACIPIFREQLSGHIVSISAIAALSNEPGFSIYGAAKAGIEAASEALCSELAPFGVKVSLICPGPFRTEFTGRSLAIIESHPDYASTVGKFSSVLRKINGQQPGDPKRAAEAIYSIAGMEKPPFRLFLGKYAIAKAEKKVALLQKEIQQWKEVGIATDF